MIDSITAIDLIIIPIFLIVFYLIAYLIKQRHIELNPSYRFYISGLFAKLFGAIAICMVYLYYFRGGDTLGYHHDGVVLSKAFLKAPYQMLRVTFGGIDEENYRIFDYDTDWLIYGYDPRAQFFDRITWPINLASFSSFVGETMLLAFICYQAIWRMFQMLVYEFPTLQKQMAISVLFIPSVVFWGSGLLKDAVTFASAALFISSIHQIFKLKKSILLNTFWVFLSSFLLLRIKPYIFFALLPGSILWIMGIVMSTVQNRLVKSSITPLFIFLSMVSGYMMLRVIGDSLGDFRVDNVMNKAAVTQQDLKQDYYGGSSFDIGDFAPTPRGILAKAPAAIFAALFRPGIWEARNPGMLVSALENLILLALTIYLLIKLKVVNLFRLMFRHHFLFFSIFFSLFFAFSIGLTTSNFGSMVRYKIPAVPFFVASLFIIANTYKELKRSQVTVETGSELAEK